MVERDDIFCRSTQVRNTAHRFTSPWISSPQRR